MSVKVEYKDCLKFYIVTLESNASKLAKYINVDSSLVNKWLKGTRLPSLKSNYSKEIAIYLSNQIKTSFQMKEIREFHFGLDPNILKIDDMAVQIHYVLTESRGFSNIKKKKYCWKWRVTKY